jgi:phytoene dehydrogenase-like protein
MYDTIVIGNDLSSLIAATILAKHGKKTVLLSENNNCTIFSESQYAFNLDPFPLTGFGSTQMCSRIFADLGIPVVELSGLHVLNPGLQIILPDHRIDCFSDRDKLLKDMEREFAGSTDDIRKLYASILKVSNLFYQWISENPYIYPKTYKEFTALLKDIPAFIRDGFSISRAFRSIRKNSSLYRVFDAEIFLLSNCYRETGIHPILLAIMLSLPLRGLYYHAGGNELLLRSIRSRFEDYGGCIINNCSVIRTSIGKEIDVDIQENDALSTIKGRYLIASTKWEKFRWLLLNNRKLRRLERRLKSVNAAYHPFTLHIGALEKGIPEKMANYVVLISDKNRPVMDDNLVFMEISEPGDIVRAPFGKRALSATVFLKKSPLILNDEELKDVSTAVLQSVETYLPFLKENVDFVDINKSIELSRKYQEVVNQKYTIRSDSFFGMPYISNKTPMRNVYMTGGMLLAGLGFEGEILSGVNAANSILAQEEKKYG